MCVTDLCVDTVLISECEEKPLAGGRNSVLLFSVVQIPATQIHNETEGECHNDKEGSKGAIQRTEENPITDVSHVII